MRNIEKEKDREKEKIGDIGPAKLNDKKSDRGPERQIRSHFLLEEQNEFVAAVGKMRNASCHPGRNERQ